MWTDLQVLWNAVRYAAPVKAGTELDRRRIVGEELPLTRLLDAGFIEYLEGPRVTITAAGVEALKELS